MRKFVLTVATVAASLTAIAAVPAQAQRGYPRGYDPYAQQDRGYDRDADRGYGRDADHDYDLKDNRGGYDREYDRDYDRRQDRRQRQYRGGRCDNGTGGTVIGAIVGGLAGNELAGRRGDRTAGTLLGGVIGAIAGGAIDRSNSPCR